MKTNPLNHIKIASPCPADWDKMYGDNRKRFCTECKLNVYNLSEMTQHEAENFLFEAEGRVCVRLYRRNDGTVITQNCPVGWRAIKQRVSRVATATFSLVFGFFGGIFGLSQISFDNSKLLEDVVVNKPDIVKGINGQPINEVKLKSSESNTSKKGGIDFSGGVSNMDEMKFWIFTERFPK